YRYRWYREAEQQVVAAVFGGLLFLVVARLDYRIFRKLARPMFWATVAGLGLIAVVALLWRGGDAPGVVGDLIPKINGSRRWISVLGLKIQISEIARFTLPVMVATLAAELGSGIRRFKSGFLVAMQPIAIVAALVAVQPNLSMAILLTLLSLSVIFIAGAKVSHLLLLGTLGAAGAGAMMTLSSERSSRMDDYLAPAVECSLDDQVCNSLIGLGNGGVFGVGYGEGTQKLGRLSYGYSDFILSVLGEEWGFVGVTLVLLCFVLFCWMGFRVARTTTDPFGTALAGGLTATVAFAALFHAAVVLKMVPATGLTLPFISAGRVSLVIYLLSAGVLVSIGRQRGRAARRR
ncbi:MAG TPA: FtsW/RodA/SpoVE family cell cycle protein, partial [Gemmatimonadales bacterium]|nr:FtsW/RodA/SpoVE family cell cycle protein [Gemmatimonadales bacterium]